MKKLLSVALALLLGIGSALADPPVSRFKQLQITGQGSTGDVSGMSVTPSGSGAAASLSSLLAYTPRVSSGVVSLLNGPTLGTYQNGQYTAQPYNINLQGSGSTGDVSGMSVTAGGSTSTLAARFPLLAPINNPIFLGTVTVPNLSLTGSGSIGDISGMSVAPSGFGATSASLANLLALTLPHVATNAALKGVSLPYTRIRRDGFSAAGDGGAADYTWSSTNCVTPDDGAQVQPTGRTGCWLADLSGISSASVNLWGALPTSNGTPGNGTDVTLPMQAAINWQAVTGKHLHVPASAQGLMRRTTASLTVDAHAYIGGDYCAPYTNGTSFSPGAGSTFFFDHPGRGIVVGSVATGPVEGVVLADFCTYRAQPTPPANNANGTAGGTWSPGSFDYDIVAVQDDLSIRHVITVNPTKAVLQLGGRIEVDGLKGQPYQNGITITSALDTPVVNNVHFWPFGVQNQAVVNYVISHLDAFYPMRADNLMLSNFRAIYSYNCIRIGQFTGGSANINGTVNKLHGTNIDCDLFGNAAVTTDAASSGATGQFNNLSGQGYGSTAAAGSRGINLVQTNGTNAHLDFSLVRSTNTQGSGIAVGGTGNSVGLVLPFVETFGQDGVTLPAISAASGNTVQVVGQPTIGAGGATGYTAYGGAGSIVLSAPADTTGRVVGQGVNAAPPPTLLVAQGGTNALKAGAGLLVLTDIGSGAVGTFMVANGAVTLISQTGTEFVALNPGDTSANAVARTGSGKVSVYYDTGTGSYSVANNTGSTLSYGYAQLVTRATN